MPSQVGWRAAALAVLVVLATGCGVTVYEPGEYKGSKDPLLDLQGTDEQRTLLQERFTKGQADR
jgi:hypothetical protein